MKQNVSTQYSSNDFFVLEDKAIYFAKENEIIDCVKIMQCSNTREIYISWFGLLLTGGAESNLPHNECFFGTLDSKDSNLGLDTLQPIYQLISNLDSEFLESKINFTESSNTLSTLHIFLNNSTLTILNYFLLDSSLNIKLECKSTESKEILEREKAQREKQKEKDSQTIDSTTSTAFLHPILEDNELKCPHNGVVKLKSNKGKSFKSKGIPMILESDLINSSIVGCTNNIAGVPTPCTMVATILPNARALKKYNDDYPIMQDLVSGNVFSDKGFSLICIPKKNKFRINSPKPIDSNTQNKQKLESQIHLYKPTLRLHYKITPLQKDNLPIYRLKLNDSIIESNNDTPLDFISIDIAKDTKDLNDINTLDGTLQDTLSMLHFHLKQSFMKEYMYKYVSLQLDSNMLLLILLIPQTIPKIYKEAYKNYEYKDYGIGRFQYVYEYCDTIVREKRTILYKTLYAPAKIKKIELEIASGLDSMIEEREGALKMLLINETYQYKREDTQANPLHTTDKESKDSKAILEIYFSYGEDKIRLNDISRYSQDINLHIRTQGYEEGEEVEVKVKIQDKSFTLKGKVNNNEVFIKNAFKDK
ncbi:hypothetical protein [Helicobacter bilis]|uniref:hypothetical protein n=1 Tax=Helicobacter bilis TaxID=37372 RepID=UPI0025A9C11C|nr:hypothetical protein [Helicobacter bilis]